MSCFGTSVPPLASMVFGIGRVLLGFGALHYWESEDYVGYILGFVNHVVWFGGCGGGEWRKGAAQNLTGSWG